MPPVNVLPVIVIANGVPLATIPPPLEITMPWLVAMIVPESTIEPLTVPAPMMMPVLALIVPELKMSPKNDDTGFEAPITMPVLATAEIAP